LPAHRHTRLQQGDPAVPAGHAPRKVETFFATFADRWNETVTAPARDGLRSAEHGKLLAKALFDCEQQTQQGLGVGHSLMATVVVERATTVGHRPSRPRGRGRRGPLGISGPSAADRRVLTPTKCFPPYGRSFAARQELSDWSSSAFGLRERRNSFSASSRIAADIEGGDT
jgi:hypothetical protein